MISLFKGAATVTALIVAAALYGCGNDEKGTAPTARSTSTARSTDPTAGAITTRTSIVVPYRSSLPPDIQRTASSRKIAGCLKSKPGYHVFESAADIGAEPAQATDGAVAIHGDGWSADVLVEHTEAEASAVPGTFRSLPEDERPTSFVRTGRVVLMLYGTPTPRTSASMEECVRLVAGDAAQTRGRV